MYTKIEVDLDRCSLSTIIEIWLYSKNNNKIGWKKELEYLCKNYPELLKKGIKKWNGIG